MTNVYKKALQIASDFYDDAEHVSDQGESKYTPEEVEHFRTEVVEMLTEMDAPGIDELITEVKSWREKAMPKQITTTLGYFSSSEANRRLNSLNEKVGGEDFTFQAIDGYGSATLTMTSEVEEWNTASDEVLQDEARQALLFALMDSI
jgi:hypothetical protein